MVDHAPWMDKLRCKIESLPTDKLLVARHAIFIKTVIKVIVAYCVWVGKVMGPVPEAIKKVVADFL